MYNFFKSDTNFLISLNLFTALVFNSVTFDGKNYTLMVPDHLKEYPIGGLICEYCHLSPTNIKDVIISLSGLALGIGMLVDNSIVVIENIYRLRGEGYSIRKAAVEGASQVSGAIVASTLTTVCVFAPIIFTEGITRQLFVDIALTIAFTLTASLLVALNFVPMMAAG